MRHLGMEQRTSMSITSRAVQFQGSTSKFDGPPGEVDDTAKPGDPGKVIINDVVQ
jgi:hypothetical protein